ncbi:MAG: nucleotidyl transferase AbiEii/AbiGii toxin family protein [Ignavibacteriaceae bacterium]|nr:nucleotidyl transferase AbiEii/AbiGii toxin family protein [Ignavibacteriaceae bacterium]
MAKKGITNIAASVKEKLNNYSKKNSLEFNSVLLQYIQERFLFRISKSVYANNFVLKGALLFLAHDISRLRPTKDIDLLGSSLPNKADSLKEIFKEIAIINFDDGLVFDPDSVTAEEITEQDEYNGVRIKITAGLGSVKQKIQIDIGFGDVIYPGSVIMDYPTLLDYEAPHLNVYSLESAVAEKFEAIVSLGIATSRMKDFYDIHFFASGKEFDLFTLHKALTETFNNGQTSIDKRRSVFRDNFKNDENLQTLWPAFLKKRLLNNDFNFPGIVSKIETFIESACNYTGITQTWNYKEWKWF